METIIIVISISNNDNNVDTDDWYYWNTVNSQYSSWSRGPRGTQGCGTSTSWRPCRVSEHRSFEILLPTTEPHTRLSVRSVVAINITIKEMGIIAYYSYIKVQNIARILGLCSDLWNVSYIELRIWKFDFKFAVQYHMKHFIYHCTFIPHRLIRTHKWPPPNVSGFIAQLVRAWHRHREVTGANNVEILTFSAFYTQLLKLHS